MSTNRIQYIQSHSDLRLNDYIYSGNMAVLPSHKAPQTPPTTDASLPHNNTRALTGPRLTSLLYTIENTSEIDLRQFCRLVVRCVFLFFIRSALVVPIYCVALSSVHPYHFITVADDERNI